MAYIFKEDELPSLISVVPGRERIFFVNQELANIDDMLAGEKHRLRATEPLFYFEFQAPNRFKTTILEGTDDDLRWERKDGRVWVQT